MLFDGTDCFRKAWRKSAKGISKSIARKAGAVGLTEAATELTIPSARKGLGHRRTQSASSSLSSPIEVSSLSYSSGGSSDPSESTMAAPSVAPLSFASPVIPSYDRRLQRFHSHVF